MNVLIDGCVAGSVAAALAVAGHEVESVVGWPPDPGDAAILAHALNAGQVVTNVKQLELLLTRQQDVSLFADARLDFLVFDEAHTFSGAQGAETACLSVVSAHFVGERLGTRFA